ncbi:MAG: TRAP transporter small permease subunit [Hyphomonas sp.]
MDPQFFILLGSGLKWIGLCALPLFLLPLLVLVLPHLTQQVGKAVFKTIDRITGFALAGAMVAAVSLIVLQLIVVVMSYAFGLSWTWMSELVVYAFATMFMLGAAAALRDDAHVRVDILRPRFGENGRNWVELAGIYLLLFPICIRLLTTGEQGLARSWMLLEGSRETDGLPIVFLFKTLVPVFAILMLGQGLSEALKAALRLTGHLAPAAKTEEGDAHHGA